jgi:hypothetical protein
MSLVENQHGPAELNLLTIKLYLFIYLVRDFFKLPKKAGIEAALIPR